MAVDNVYCLAGEVSFEVRFFCFTQHFRLYDIFINNAANTLEE